MDGHDRVFRLVENTCPGLMERVEHHIRTAERAFTSRVGQPDGGFLWGHTRQVAAIAFLLAEREGESPLAPVLAALFHDAGKFHQGEYHPGSRAEEAHAADVADGLLAPCRVPAGVREAIRETLDALYQDRSSLGRAGRIVHDADCLAKLGRLGVAAFFTRATLRGQPLDEAVRSSLGRELTYAAAAPRTMLTESGRAVARTASRQTFRFFKGLLLDLDIMGIGRYRCQRIRLPRSADAGHRTSAATAWAVWPSACDGCGNPLPDGTPDREKGVKCEMLRVRTRCPQCGREYETAYCLPQVTGESSGG